ncbi:MAG: DUF1643 domain-containing protein [Planctomycetes bacterium]|nr:DUF1643 domain-containing protein [Planctomycetota bacterium]
MPGSVKFGGPKKRYRYLLERWWVDGPNVRTICFVMLNPSTADDKEDDPTLRCCIRIAKRESFDRLLVVNLFAFRSTDPEKLLSEKDPIGKHNKKHILKAAAQAKKIVLAWGNNGSIEGQASVVLGFLSKRFPDNLWCLGVTKLKHPKHPVRLRKDTPLVQWPPKQRRK